MKEPDGSVWVVRTHTDGQRIFAEKRDDEEAAFDLALEQSVDGDVYRRP
ncbi:hypothetical protein [Halogeometricum luteum]|uniref:DUF2188 domain-containing protein n=1 Tax=Halogeometricum luteum TaxID=2950537 RepID=A0ABU2G781_9EURY|nr:hypothetical protein [Halogeometricum sp. S3BR5-2]MDS0296658.1 hypothetical protein [Halogeometricum sp. S3BR5-2]